jgi:hypothetical protein
VQRYAAGPEKMQWVPLAEPQYAGCRWTCCQFNCEAVLESHDTTLKPSAPAIPRQIHSKTGSDTDLMFSQWKFSAWKGLDGYRITQEQPKLLGKQCLHKFMWVKVSIASLFYIPVIRMRTRGAFYSFKRILLSLEMDN